MNCPLKAGNADGLLDYAAGKLEPQARARMDSHLAECAACREFAGGQQEIWRALDAWEAPVVSTNFDRRLYQRIEQQPRSWWNRLMRPLDPLWRHALPIAAAAGVVLMAGLLLDHPRAVPVASVTQSAQVETLRPDQVEVAVDDIEMLREFNHLVPDPAAPKM